MIYLAEEAEREALLARLGPHRTGRACLYIKREGRPEHPKTGRPEPRAPARLRARQIALLLRG